MLVRAAAPGALAALATALLLALAARLLPLRPARRQMLGAAAPVAAILAGWAVALGAAILHPRDAADRVPAVAAGAFALALLADRRSSGRGLPIALALIGALAAGWFLSGAPFAPPAPRELRAMLAGIGLTAALAAAPAGLLPGPWPLTAACFALWASLHLAGTMPGDAGLALVLLGACAGFLSPSRDRAASLWPVAFGCGGVAAATLIDSGRLIGRGGFGRAAWAAAAPVVVIALIALLRWRNWGPRASAAAAAMVAVLAIWIAGGMSR